MQAIMLAAGKGSRLGKYTKNNTKCMLNVHGKTLLERAIDALLEANIKDFILVLGYKGDNVKKYIEEKELDKKINIKYVYNNIYDTTNNIYSLYLAKDYLAKDDTILLESDLIYGKSVVKKLVNSQYESVALIAKYEEWMDGTVVTIDENNVINSFVERKDFNYKNVNNYYKTVNIYKFSKEFSNRFYLPFLESYIKAYGNNDYYELVLKVISGLKEVKLHGLQLTGEDWYEIDDCQDYDIVKAIFAPTTEEKLELFHKRFGGYWRFNGIKDYCYLVNPYFPTKQMIDKMKYFYNELLFNYPSGQKIEKICASRMFNNVSEDNILIGNGAAELINTLKYIAGGKIGLTIPSFNEYVRCFPNSEILYINSKDDNYCLSFNRIANKLDEVDTMVIISPDNPTGSHLKYDEVIKLLDLAKQKDKQIIFDESFIDFANNNYTLIDDYILNVLGPILFILLINKINVTQKIINVFNSDFNIRHNMKFCIYILVFSLILLFSFILVYELIDNNYNDDNIVASEKVYLMENENCDGENGTEMSIEDAFKVGFITSDNFNEILLESSFTFDEERNVFILLDSGLYAVSYYTSPSPRDRTRSRMPSSA